MDINKARRAAQLYSRWHRTYSYVYARGPDNYDWTAVFKVDDGRPAIPGVLMETYLDGKPTET